MLHAIAKQAFQLRPLRSLPPAIVVATWLVCASTLAGCSDPATNANDVTSGADAVDDGVGLADAVSLSDAPTAVVVDPAACPGGWGCSCAANADCATGVCLASVGGASNVCATECADGVCPVGERCRALGGSAGLHWICVDGRTGLCDPCTDDAQCRVFGLQDAACADYGARGNFCAVSCTGDADCGEDYRCGKSRSISGDDALRCVRIADVGDPESSLGTCPCSTAASAAKRSTSCYVETFALGRKIGRCVGTRACGDAGLSACTAVAPKAEACDGVDDDCDGQTDEFTCGDGNPCTDDACDLAKGCSNTNVDKACDADGSACTVADACSGGSCVAGKALKCDDANGCTVDSCDSVIGCRNIASDGASCDDGAKCTVGDACKAKACVAGVAKACADDDSCTLDSCDGASGDCVHQALIGVLCDDGDVCTHTDLCTNAGTCAGAALPCDDGKACTTDACEAGKGCVFTQSVDGAGCDDGNQCTGPGTCSGGVCLAGPPKQCTTPGPCFVAACLAKSGECIVTQRASGLFCDDGDVCTGGGLCDANGDCKATAVNCDDGNPCTTDACDNSSGACKSSAKTNGAACDDGDACTAPDTCESGVCSAGDNVCGCSGDGECDDNNACTVDTCVSATKKCDFKTSSASCDDGDACTFGDVCGDDAGKAACLPGATTQCDDGNACTDDACDPKVGCGFVAKADGSPCDDGEICTAGDACAAGSCKPGNDTCACANDGDCDDGNACSKDLCDLGKKTCAASVPLAKGATCSDDDACTGPDGCDGAGEPACAAGVTLDCDDSDACTVDSCDSDKGCVHVAVDDGGVCNDGDSCTANDGCIGGKCVGTPPSATVSTWAGSVQGYTDAKGELAAFKAPTGVARAADGVLYVADIGDHRVRKIAVDQTVTTLAGQGVVGEVDDTGVAARFYGPAALALNADGDLVVLDSGSHKVRLVKVADGAVTTLAGSNTPGGFGKPPVGGFADGKGALAQLKTPMGIAASGVGFFIADAGNHRIRTLAADGSVGTLAGAGGEGGSDGPVATATFASPYGVAVDGAGAVWVAEFGGHRIRRISGATVATIAGDGVVGAADGKGASARFSAPWGLWFDGAGALLVADSGNHRIRVVAGDGTVTTYFGSVSGSNNGALATATLATPTTLVSDLKGKLFIAGQAGFKVRVVNDLKKACALAL